MQKILSTIAKVRKALIAGAAVAGTIAGTVGLPANVRAGAADVVAILLAIGVTYKVPNTPA